METRILGKSGLKASVIGLGCWQLGGDFGSEGVSNTNAILSAADESGITFWDTADVYGAGRSEQKIGEWADNNVKKRTIVTKVGRDGSLYPDQYTENNIRKSIENSLRRLKVDSIDLIQLHCVPPNELKSDRIWDLLDKFRSQGLIKHYGASVETIEEGLSCIDRPGLTSLQIIFNLFRQDAKQSLLKKAAQADVGIIARLPLASGLLSGKFTQNTEFSEQDHRNYNKDGDAFNVGETFSGLRYTKALELVDKLRTFTTEHPSLPQFALRWILDHPEVTTVIAGASSADQVAQNAMASNLKPLSAELHEQLYDFYMNFVKENVRGNI